MAELTRKSQAVNRAGETASDRIIVPAVDIAERDDVIVLTADMPGVSRETLTIEVDNGALVLEGQVRISTPDGLSATFAELAASRYVRRFRIGDELDTDKIEAAMRDGVLTLRLPKKAMHQRRRIEVNAA